VDLVEDHEPEAVAEFVGPEVGRIVGRHRHALDALFAAAEPTDRRVELGFELALPLFEQIDRRDDDQRRRLGIGDRSQRDDCFARAGGEFEDAPAVAVDPRVEGVLLVVAEFVARRQGQRVGGEDAVLYVGIEFPEEITDRRVEHRRGAGGVAPGVGFDTRQAAERRIALAVAGDPKRAVLEGEPDCHCRKSTGSL